MLLCIYTQYSYSKKSLNFILFLFWYQFVAHILEFIMFKEFLSV